MARSRDLEVRYCGDGTYFYITPADRDQRRRVRHLIEPRVPLLALRHFWVAPEKRGTGAGKKLVQQVTGVADALGLPLCFWVNPYDNNPLGKEGLLRFYENAGYQKVCVARSGVWAGCPLMIRRRVK